MWNLKKSSVISHQSSVLSRCNLSSTTFPQRKSGAGFTLIEILVVVAIIVGLASILLLYGRGGESQLVLFKEQSKLLSIIYRAKALSIETFSNPSPPCGYGIHLDPPDSYFIFKDMPPPTGCKDSDKKYGTTGTVTDEIVDRYHISRPVSLGALPVTDILFIPPDPKTVFQYINPGDTADPVVINLTTAGSSLGLSISSAGQITLP